MADEAKRIGMLGKELYERLAGAAGSLKKLGNRLNGAVAEYNSFVGSFEGRVLVTGRKLGDLNIETGGKGLEGLEPVAQGREECRGRGCQDGGVSVGAGNLKKEMRQMKHSRKK